ncbi:Inositol 2-dehydrogenase [Lentibacillus sp. JNUCC-1]|uniref:Gfo/Idh/MocA family protein n=1 Tax=Lentibacillus sp. JNUCC-1 TaxID=2654513 RepID=UPI0012E810AA|nr:Gfo/Idh/MocA family oxidoreductase [Lentibacillus sp. JNUCC-1]MUV37261.1 Inositol 2-dehydrogenase [Lentibacillus sp. JNUCC-1]
MTRVAIAGYGEQLIERYEAWSKIKDFTVTGVLDLSNKTDYLTHEMKELCINSLNAFQEQEVDWVDISVPVENRPELIRLAADIGMHVTCDIPFARTVEESAALIETCQEKGVGIHPIGSLRFSPAYQNASGQVASGAIGKTGVLRLAKGSKHPGVEKDIFLDLGLSQFDWLLSTFGSVGHVLGKHIQTQNAAGDTVEYAAVTLRMEDQSIAHIELSWAQPSGSASFELTGDSGMLSYDSASSQPIVLNISEKVQGDVLAVSVLEREIKHFADVAHQEAELLVTGADILEAMKVAEAVRQSVETGEPVYMERSGS